MKDKAKQAMDEELEQFMNQKHGKSTAATIPDISQLSASELSQWSKLVGNEQIDKVWEWILIWKLSLFTHNSNLKM